MIIELTTIYLSLLAIFFIIGNTFFFKYENKLSKFYNVIFSIGAGKIIVVFVLGILAVMKQFYLINFIILISPFVFVGIWNFYKKKNLNRLIEALKSFIAKIFTSKYGKFELVLIFFVFCQILNLSVKVLTPTIHFDALNDYSRYTIKIVQNHSFVSGEWCSGHPQNVFLLGALGTMISDFFGFSIYNTSLLRMIIGFGPLLLCLISIMVLSFETFGKKASLLSGSIFLSIEAVLFLSQSGKIFFATFYFEFLFFLVLYRWLILERNDLFLLIWSGVFLGGALSCKWSAYLNGPPLLVLCLSLFFLYDNKKKWFKDSLTLLTVILLTGFIWNIYFSFIPVETGSQSSIEMAKKFFLRSYSGITGIIKMMWEYSGRKEVILNSGQKLGPLLILFFPLIPVLLQRKLLNKNQKYMLLYGVIFYISHYLFRQRVRDALLPVTIFAFFAGPVLTKIIYNFRLKFIRGCFFLVFVLLCLGTLARQIQNNLWAKRYKHVCKFQTSKDYYRLVAWKLFSPMPDIPIEDYLRKYGGKYDNLIVMNQYFDLFIRKINVKRVNNFDNKKLSDLLKTKSLILVRKSDIKKIEKIKVDNNFDYKILKDGNSNYLLKIQ